MTTERVYTLGLRYVAGSPFIRYLAVKRHEQAHGVGAALFVSGLPQGATEEVLKELFECFGPVSQAVLHPLKRSGIVVFGSEAGRLASLKYASRGQVLEYAGPAPRLPGGGGEEGEEGEGGEEANTPIGLKVWVAEHKAARPGNEVLQAQIDDWMDAFDEEQERRARERQAAMGEDGWTVVVRAKGRKRTREEGGVTVQTGGAASNAAAAAAAAAAAKDAKTGQLGDFYRFQRRERRRNELVELRQRFEDDRRRLAQLKATRNFKPC
ncbi:hypothetical protein HYH03_005328 [Edaphochlamys debaryana]|uniref:RRM domain-containing protein n=1 Tax=Edaphochlamys debaryana TaxID=47281 RepID=A0A835Y5R3_9CHLO|nr:hypothetical protein HYH03_005328 [Edaphochlamys debaryana]|eukprot:KAG2496503.1 hypothetical protein HYH03_005328 [Edaphochlamys debaryana]